MHCRVIRENDISFRSSSKVSIQAHILRFHCCYALRFTRPCLVAQCLLSLFLVCFFCFFVADMAERCFSSLFAFVMEAFAMLITLFPFYRRMLLKICSL